MENRSNLQIGPNHAVREHHSELYFADGDIVLQAKLSTATEDVKLQLYCVHKAILSFHSVFFTNLFADGFASPEAIYDGRPLVEMLDDADDLSHLLRFLYKPAEYLLRSSHPDTALELRGAARLAGKYLMDSARADMIRRVVLDWPTACEDWVAHQAQFQALKRATANICRPYAQGPHYKLADRTPEPVAAIVFAQEHGCTEILPAAFYRLAMIESDAEWARGPRRGRRAYDTTLRARWALCDRDNLARWVRGRKELETYCDRYPIDVRYADMLDAGDYRGCRPGWVHERVHPCDIGVKEQREYPCFFFLQALGKAMQDVKPAHDPLTMLAELEAYVNDEKVQKTCASSDGLGLCFQCDMEFGDWLREERERLWERLPTIFNLKVS